MKLIQIFLTVFLLLSCSQIDDEIRLANDKDKLWHDFNGSFMWVINESTIESDTVKINELDVIEFHWENGERKKTDIHFYLNDSIIDRVQCNCVRGVKYLYL